MFCPSDVNTGFIQLVGPIQQQDLNTITVKSYPLSISFAPRTTPPSLIGNRIDESTENTCTYRGQRFSLVDVQICSPVSKGYTLPGQTNEPVAELMLSFSSNKAIEDLSTLSGIIMCIPIYDSGVPRHADYINQLIDTDIPSCNYTHLVGSEYTGGDYNNIPNLSLASCIKNCCDDVNCLAYTFSNGTCYMKNSIPAVKKTGDKSIISGTVNHNVKNKNSYPVQNCPTSNCNKKNDKNDKNNKKQSGVPNLETIFYAFDNDVTQTSLAYKTCFETIDSNNLPSSRSLYVVVFPNGITLTQSGFQQLLIQLNGNLPTYMIPPAIRGGDSTLRSFKFDDEGNKIPTLLSQDGIIYSTPLSSCTDEFRHRFEFFSLPPRLPITSSNTKWNTEQCPYYKTSQYKCVPFNQLTDLGNLPDGSYVIPGNKTLDTILAERQQLQKGQTLNSVQTSDNTLTTDQIETIIAGVIGGGIALSLLIWAGTWISKKA
jgi:hypothetical protein